MGWQTLSASLRNLDSDGSQAKGEVEAAAKELLASGDDAQALQCFSEALDPSLQQGNDFLQLLSKTKGAKCRCDAVWYGDTIAYGCKTCGLSSASCICVFCFDAGDHEGHDFYISRSDYGCCDCGDAYAWRKSGFCRHHPGPQDDVDPAQLLPEATRRRAELLIPAQVRHLTICPPCKIPEVSASSSASVSAADTEPCDQASGEGSGASNHGTLEGAEAETSMEAVTTRVLVSGINLRVTEEQLRDFFVGKLAAAVGSESVSSLSVDLVRDPETKASRGRAYLTVIGETSMQTVAKASGEVLRGSSLKVHCGEDAIAVAEKHLQALETNFEWLLNLGGFHDGLRKIIGEVVLDSKLLGKDASAVEVLLRDSHLLEPSIRKLETNLIVDLMLDLNFKHRFALVFTRLYRELVLNRKGNQDTNELGDFTCQIFTRQDVTMELVREGELIRNLLGCLWELLHPALVKDSDPLVFNHESNIFRDHEIIQCSMDLLYVLDHAEIAREIVRSPLLRDQLWQGWLLILVSMQAMNSHKRRFGTHVEFTNPSWGNALTLHTDLMSNTWLILDAVESNAELDAIQDMGRLAWSELRAWMQRVHVAEGRVLAGVMEGTIEYQVSQRSASFHLPVNRVLALLVHHLCLRASHEKGTGGGTTTLQEGIASIGLSCESDLLSWMEHPLRALVLHHQVCAGMWRRNGEALEKESDFYRMNYWHHLLIDMDLLVLRMSALVLRPETFFRTVLSRFELWPWLRAGDPLVGLLSSGTNETASQSAEFGMQKLQSCVLLLYQLLSPNTHFALGAHQLVMHTTRQLLSTGPKSHSQLWDPRLERSTATATAKDQQMLEQALREIATFAEADGSGYSSAKYHLKDDQWFAVDPYFHLFSWSEQQKVEENLAAALRGKGASLHRWVEESAKLRPQALEAYQNSFESFCRCGFVQAIIWLLLVRLAFHADFGSKSASAVLEGRLPVLALMLALRSALAQKPETDSDQPDIDVCEDIPMDEVQVFQLAKVMGPHLCSTARRRYRIRVQSAQSGEPPVEREVLLFHAVERLATAPAETMVGGLARGLRECFLRDPRNRHLVQAAEPQSPARSAVDPAEISLQQQSPSSMNTETPSPQDLDEARRAKRRKAAQERQQKMLDDLRKRQAAFITGVQGQKMMEEASPKRPACDEQHRANCAESQTPPEAECVVCMSHQEGEDGDNPLGLLCFLRPAPANCLPRPCAPTEQAVLLQAPKAPLRSNCLNRGGPYCFSPQAPDGLVLARACSHKMHFSCWSSFQQNLSSGNRLTCPYCNTAANAFLPAGGSSRRKRPAGLSFREANAIVQKGESILRLDDSLHQQHAEASSDFTSRLEGQLRRLGDQHLPPPQLSEALEVGSTALSHPMIGLAKLCADSITLADVRLRTRPAVKAAALVVPTYSGSSSSSAAPQARHSLLDSAASTYLQSLLIETLRVAPNHVAAAAVRLTCGETAGRLGDSLLAATPHGRFQMLTVLLLSLCAGPNRGGSAEASRAARILVHGFYLLESAVVLAALADGRLIEAELRKAAEGRDNHAEGSVSLLEAGIWRCVWALSLASGELAAMPGRTTPVQTREEAVAVLKLALNPFLFKTRQLLAALSAESDASDLLPSLNSEGPVSPDEQHLRLISARCGLISAEELLDPNSGTVDAGALMQLLGDAASIGAQHFRGLQPPSPLVLVLVSAADEPPAESPAPNHIWHLSPLGFERLHAAGYQEFVELSTEALPDGCEGKFFCVAYRMTLPVITGRVYQKFYTQFVNARCTNCKTTPSIPTICLLCGTFLCCNSECCRRDGEGEVTRHAQTCGLGTCIFLQLSNSLVHIVADGFITCWGSLYLDGHGEEEYNLARPLHMSEARLQQLTQSIREVSLDFEPRLKWKKVIFV